MPEETLFIPASGFDIEAAVYVPPDGPHGGTIICHPHPQYGGNMHNNVVMGVQEAVASVGFATLRFNFRGVGKSGGGLAGPDGDPEDVSHVIDYFRNRDDIVAEQVAVVGYSYGAMVGLAASIMDPEIPALVAISPPVGAFQMDFISRIESPLLAISGDRDTFCPLDKLESMLPAGATLNVVRGADHLYRGFEGEAGQVAASFLKARLSGP